MNSMNGASIIEVRKDAKHKTTTVFLRIPRELAQPITGGCSCAYCKAHPDMVPTWDCLAVPVERSGSAWTVHYPA